MPAKLEGLQQLLVEGLQDMYDAEKQLVKALPKLAKGASDGELQEALRQHLEVTKGQVERIEQVFQSLDMRAKSRPCKGMKGLVEEGQEILSEDHEEALADSAIAAAARKVEHYEMAGYESLRSVAQQMGLADAAQQIEQTLREEMQADKELAAIGKRLLKAVSKPQADASANHSASRKRSSATAGSNMVLTEHDEIRQWAEERNAQPVCVKGTGSKDDPGIIRLDFPGYSGEESLEPISWDDWFTKFDESNLALIVGDTTSSGEPSNFNKLVNRDTAHAEPHMHSHRE